ncbi:MAG: glycosyl hydrolase family 28 protein [Mangrovibacterium sp.]
MSASAQDKLVTYDAPGGMKYSAHNDDFTVQVREKGGEWMDLYEWKVQVDMDNVQTASMVNFDFEGDVEMKVRKNNGRVNDVQIRPLSLNIEPNVEGQVITFSLNKPTKLSLEVNGDKLHNLHVFANPIMKNVPSADDPNVIYFGPGVHKPKDQPGDVYHIPSGKTVYIDGGAVLRAKLLVDNAEDVKIIGRGIIWQPERGVEIRHSKNVAIDGLVFVNPSHYTIYGGETTGLNIKNIKSFSCKGWSDGIDLMSCSGVNIDGVFMRNSDDCIAIYGHRWDFYGDVRNYQVRNSTLWADIAHPIQIGLHGDANNGGNTIENLHFENIDILEQDEDDRNYQGCMSISCSDDNFVSGVTFKNIRIEDIQEGQLFNFRVVYNNTYSHAPGRGVEKILIEDVTYDGALPNPSIMHGYSDDRSVREVTIKNLVVNGKKITATGELIRIGDNVEGVSFK